ncbi:hypothetical protein ABZ934_02655 [Streptomyces sp. NPDC046557]|uniref:hypothetical protein n=1 Tax=Streptomyces sp. NPDC046557 TaxID=3155372 RepID=UPI0033E02FAC
MVPPFPFLPQQTKCPTGLPRWWPGPAPGRPARPVADKTALVRIRLPRSELSAWRTAARGELRGLVKPLLRRQIEACLTARADGTGPLELHAGRPYEEPLTQG